MLLNYHIGRIVLVSMCVGVSLWLGWSGIRVAVTSIWSFILQSSENSSNSERKVRGNIPLDIVVSII